MSQINTRNLATLKQRLSVLNGRNMSLNSNRLSMIKPRTRAPRIPIERKERAVAIAVEHGPRVAADQTGISISVIRREMLKKGVKRQVDRSEQIDADLAILCCLVDPDYICTLDEIGDVIGISRERVRQIEANALKKLRKKAVKMDELREEFGFEGDWFSGRGKKKPA